MAQVLANAIDELNNVRLPALPAKRAVALLFKDTDALRIYQKLSDQSIPQNSCVFSATDLDSLVDEVAKAKSLYNLPKNARTLWFTFGQNYESSYSITLFPEGAFHSFNDGDTIYVSNSETGMQALSLYAWLCSVGPVDDMPKSGVLECLLLSSVYSNSIQAAISSLSKQIGSDEVSTLYQAQLDSGLKNCVERFIEKTEPWPGLRAYPINADRLRLLSAKRSLAKRILRKGTIVSEQTQLAVLFGNMEDGAPLADRFVEEHVREVHCDHMIFESIWRDVTAFYYHIPMNWIRSHIVSTLKTECDKADAILQEKMQALHTTRTATLFGTEPKDVLNALYEREKQYRELFSLCLKRMFFQEALHDAQKGAFSQELIQATEVFQNTLNSLQILHNGMSTEKHENETQSTLNWSASPSQYIREAIENARSKMTDWTLTTFSDEIARQQTLSCLSHGNIKPRLTAILRCSEGKKPEMENMMFGTAGQAKWRFIDSWPREFAAVVSLVPIANFKGGTIT